MPEPTRTAAAPAEPAAPAPAYTPRPPDPEALSVDALWALREAWYREAEEGGELRALGALARGLGRCTDPLLGAHEWRGQHPRAGEVRVADGGALDELTVRVAGQRVASTREGERLFVPGPWLEATRAAARDLDRGWEAREAAREAQVAAALRRELQLEPPAPPAAAEPPVAEQRRRAHGGYGLAD